MKQTEVLAYLIKHLKETGLIQYNKNFLDYVDIPNATVSAKQLSGYINRNGEIRNKEFLKKIEICFKFSQNIWTTNEERQKQLINSAIKHELTLQSLPSEDALDISTIIPIELPCNQEQLIALRNFSNLSTKRQEEEMIDKFLNIGLLDNELENQDFLVRLLRLAYDKGLYGIIVEFILPNLYRKYHNMTEVQKMEAHTYGSLGDYDNAQHILSILIDNNTIENINLKTSALSNHKRKLLQSNKKINKEDLQLLIQGYQELHAIKGIYSYYTGINLLYIVILGQLLFPDDTKLNSIKTQEIYERSKPSLVEDNTHNHYYVTMSRFEFQLLLGRDGVVQKIASFLANEEPHISLVERTIRQMKLFVVLTEKTQNSMTKQFKKTVELLESYSRVSNGT